MNKNQAISLALSDHSRSYHDNRYVYPVLSRRSKGISLGINLNPEKACNFNCVYCQVDRTEAGLNTGVEIPVIIEELRNFLKEIKSGDFFLNSKFKNIPVEGKRLNDIAFSGDGEPSLFPHFLELTEKVISLKNQSGLPLLKLVLITNASGLSRPEVQKALDLFDQNEGEIWAKLDAGTKAYFHKICRAPVEFSRILNNVLEASQKRPLVIQSCFMKLDGIGPEPDEIESYIQRLIHILKNNGKLKLIQIYTVARVPAEDYVTPLENEEVNRLVERVKDKISIPVEAYYHP